MTNIPVVLIHGYPFDHTMWFSTIAALGSKARVVAPDLPGFGRNPVLRHKTPSLEYFADFIAGELARSNYEKAVVAGMSMGGYVALAFAEKYPEKLCALGLVSSQTTEDSAEAKIARAESIEKIRSSGVSVLNDTIVPKLFGDKAPPDLRRYPVEGAEKAGVEGLCWALEAMAKRPDRTALFKSLKVPLLIVHGTQDKIIPSKKARALAEERSNAVFVEISGAGHATPLEAPDAVATGLMRLLEICYRTQSEQSSAPQPAAG
jgi:pimeloyl-ACP methyl ester carboxylesterase